MRALAIVGLFGLFALVSSAAAAAEPDATPETCTPAAGELDLPSPVSIDELLKWTERHLCHPIAGPSMFPAELLQLERGGGALSPDEQTRRVRDAFARAGLVLDTSHRVWKVVPAKKSPPEAHACKSSGKHVVASLRNPIELVAWVRLYHEYTCKKIALAPHLAWRSIWLYPTKRPLDAQELDELFRASLEAAGLTLDDERALVVNGPESTARAEPIVESQPPVEYGDRLRCAQNHCTIERALYDTLFSPETGRSARFVPAIRDGKANGFKLYAIRPSSLLGSIGFQNGDTIQTINGSSIITPDQALTVYSELRKATHVVVGIDRRGKPMTLELTIK